MSEVIAQFFLSHSKQAKLINGLREKKMLTAWPGWAISADCTSWEQRDIKHSYNCLEAWIVVEHTVLSPGHQVKCSLAPAPTESISVLRMELLEAYLRPEQLPPLLDWMTGVMLVSVVLANLSAGLNEERRGTEYQGVHPISLTETEGKAQNVVNVLARCLMAYECHLQALQLSCVPPPQEKQEFMDFRVSCPLLQRGVQPWLCSLQSALQSPPAVSHMSNGC